jgi:hypothetical protein
MPMREHFPWTYALCAWLWPESQRGRRVLVAGAALVLLFLVVHLGLDILVGRRLAAATREGEERYGSFKLETLLPPEVPDAENRAKVIRAAAELVPDPGTATRRFAVFQPDGPLSAGDRAAIDREVAAGSLVFELLDYAAARPRANWGIPYKAGVEATVPPLLAFLNVGKLNIAAGRLALLDGRYDDGVAAVARGSVVAESLRPEPSLIVQLVRSAVDAGVVGLAREIVAAAPPTEAQLTVLDRALDERDPQGSMRASLIGEMKTMLASLPGSAYAWDAVGPLPPRLLENPLLLWLLRPVLQENARWYLEVMKGVIEYQGLPRTERQRRWGDAPPAPERRAWHLLGATMVANLGNAIQRADLWETRFVLARLGVALERYRLAHGTYPERLEALVPDLLPRLPLDPFSGAPPEYHASGRGYRLRSAAEDAKLDLIDKRDPILRWEMRR